MAHKVKCLYCGEEFNRDVEPCVQIGRRYAHIKCAEEHENNKTQEEKDYDSLVSYILQLFDEPRLNARVKKQIELYHNDYQYTYSGMLKTLIYWYDIKGNTTEKANGGIGIVPYIYDEAYRYYEYLYNAQLANQDKNINTYKQPIIKTVTIPPPSVVRKKPRLFFEDEGEG